MVAARVFFLAACFNFRTSAGVHARRLDVLAIKYPPQFEKAALCSSKVTLKQGPRRAGLADLSRSFRDPGAATRRMEAGGCL